MPGKWPRTPDRKRSPASASPCASAAPPENRFWPSCGQRKRHACSTCGLCCCVRSARSPPPKKKFWPSCMQPKRRVRSWHRTEPARTACPLECASMAPPENRFWRSGMQPQQQPCMSELSGAPIEHANNMRSFIQPCSDGFQRCPGIKLRLCCMQPQTSSFGHLCSCVHVAMGNTDGTSICICICTYSNPRFVVHTSTVLATPSMRTLHTLKCTCEPDAERSAKGFGSSVAGRPVRCAVSTIASRVSSSASAALEEESRIVVASCSEQACRAAARLQLQRHSAGKQS